MPPRVPRGRDDPPVEATCEALRELASAYTPVLRYTDGEKLFPVLAESWLTHTTSAPWEDPEEDDLPVDPRRRGTAVMRDAPDLRVLGGTPNPADRPIQLTTQGGDPDSIGTYAGVGPNTFLNFAGWLDAERRSGDASYLQQAFSELGGAMNPTAVWQLIEQQQHLPHMWVPQPPTPTVYAEVEWAGMFPRWASSAGLTDFDPPGTPPTADLDGHLCLTYFYLYPMRDHAPGSSQPRRLEGQWEAISLFFPGEASQERDADGRPLTFSFREPPDFVVASQGLDRTTGTNANVICRWGSLERLPIVAGMFPAFSTAPVLYVSEGTHRHFFGPISGTRWDPSSPSPGDGINRDTAGEFPGVEIWLAWAAVLGIVAGILAAAGAIILAVLLAILALLLLLAWLVSLIMDAINQSSGDPVPSETPNEEARGDGPEGGGTEPAAGAGSEPGGTAGVPNAGSPTGRNTVAFDVRVIDMLNEAARRTGYPPDSSCEHPHWWEYTGRWGVNVNTDRPTGGEWEHGTHRVDAQRRSWAYHHAVRVLRTLGGGPLDC